MRKYRIKHSLLSVLTICLAVCLLVFPAFAANGSYTLNSVYTSVSGANSVSESGGTITVTIKGWSLGFVKGENTATITVRNDLGSDAMVSFDWTQDSNIGSLTIDGAARTAGGSFSKRMAASESITISLVSQKNTTVGTITLKNFKAEAVQSGYDTTFIDPAGGTVTVDGAEISGDTVQNVPSDGVAVSVALSSGYTFYGWVDSTHTILSTDTSFTYTPTGIGSVKPILANATDPVFRVGTTILFDDLKDAPANSVIVLAKNATLPAGTHTVESGSTLLIPFDDADTLYTNKPAVDAKGTTILGVTTYEVVSYVTPTAYRTLTMADGANLIINGAMSLSAKHHVASGGNRACGVPAGPCSFVNMKSGSSITVKNGGYLYAWGYITGSGAVTAESGATVYEYYSIEDFMGGTTTSNLNNDAETYRVFPFRAYYIQNIQVPLTVKAGAYEKGYTSIHSGTTKMVVSTEVPFIGPSNSLFTISDGKLVKDYDEVNDRLIVDLYGISEFNPINIEVYVSIASEKFDTPIPSNMTINFCTGTTTVKQSIVLLPGSQMNIAADAELAIGSGSRMIVYDSDQWNKYVFDVTYRTLTYAPNRTAAYDASELVDAAICVNGTLDASAGSLYTTDGKANIHSTSNGGTVILGTVENGSSYQYYNNAEYHTHAITSAQLKNADATYVATADVGSGTYSYADGFWHISTCAGFASSITTKAGCETDGIMTFACECGNSYTEVIPATGHTEVVDSAVAATCTGSGLTEGSHCSVCGETIVAQQEVPQLGHTAGEPKVENDTDTSYESVVYCTVCGEEISRNTISKIVYSVTITWTDLDYVFTPEYTWDTVNLRYSVTRGTWSTGGKVEIKNESTVSVWYTIATAPSTDLGWTPEISSEYSDGEIVAGKNLISNITVDGEPFSEGKMLLGTTSTQIGTVTITLRKEE